MGLLTPEYREWIFQEEYIRFLATHNENNEFVCVLCQHGSFSILGDGRYCTIFHESTVDGSDIKTLGINCENCGMIYKSMLSTVAKWLAKRRQEENNV